MLKLKKSLFIAWAIFRNVMFSVMLMDARQDSDTGFPIRYRFDLTTLQAKPKVQTDVLDGLLSAYDMEKNAISEAKMQRVSQSCDN